MPLGGATSAAGAADISVGDADLRALATAPLARLARFVQSSTRLERGLPPVAADLGALEAVSASAQSGVGGAPREPAPSASGHRWRASDPTKKALPYSGRRRVRCT